MTGEAQASGTVLMVRPAAFGFHAQAAQSNAFAAPASGDRIATEAIGEMERLAERLQDADLEVLVLADLPEPEKPDAVFPNNWVSFHGDGTMVLYPMATERRRLERQAARLHTLLAGAGFDIRRTVDLSGHERDGRYLEGTGSLILDRPRRRAFANRSLRTHPDAVADFERQLGLSVLLFDARDRSGTAIYHTNVLLSLGTRFAILCSEVVPEEQRRGLKRALGDDRTLIEVDYEQMRQFACNVLELRGREGPVIALSSTALRSFRASQLRQLEQFGDIVAADIPTIERVGGGSVRCMIADVHLPRSV